MPNYKFPSFDRARIVEWLSDCGSVVVKPRDYGAWSLGNLQVQRFLCRAGNSRAFVRILEVLDQRDCLFVKVSTDVRRLPLIWRWRGDLRLVRRLSQVLEQNGGHAVADAGSQGLKLNWLGSVAFLASCLLAAFVAFRVGTRLLLVYRYGLARVWAENLRFVATPNGRPWTVSNGDKISEGHFLAFLFSIPVLLFLFFALLTLFHRLSPWPLESKDEPADRAGD
jgi:hypothetical protein